MAGWVKLYRSIQDHWIFSFKEPDKALAWIDLVLSANHKNGSIMIKGRKQNISRGQVGMSQLTMQKRWKWSQNKVKRFLKLLKKEQMADYHTNDLTTIVTICNYDDFQSADDTDERADERPDERPTDDQSNDKQECKNDKNGKNKDKTKRFVPPTLAEAMDYFQVRGCVDYQDQAQTFINHFTSNGWKVGGKAPMKCWKSAISNWIARRKNENVRTDHSGRKTAEPRSAAGRVSENAAIERGKIAEQRANDVSLGADGETVRPQVDEQLRGSDRSGERMGSDIEGNFTRAD